MVETRGFQTALSDLKWGRLPAPTEMKIRPMFN